jgi:hypothetical protein
VSVSTQPRRKTTGPPPPSSAGVSGTGDDLNMAGDPFIRRLADPALAKRMQQSRRDIIEGLKVLDLQREKAEQADIMYDGELGMVYASRQVRRLLARQGLDESEISDFAYAKIPVDVIANRLQIAAVKVSKRVTDEEAEESDGDDAGVEGDGADAATDKDVKKAERAVKALRRANRLDVYEKALHKNVSKHGDAFLFVWPVTDDGDKVVSVDMRVNTAHEVAFIYDREDSLQVSYVIKSWSTPSSIDDDTGEGTKDVTRVNLYYPGERTVDADGEMSQGAGRIERWVTQPGASEGKADSWVRVHDPVLRADIDPEDLEEVAADSFGDPDDPLDADDIPSPFGLTWFHFRNNVPGGIPEHVSAYGPQMLINKLIWSYAGTVEYMGFPQRYLMVDPKIDDPLLNVSDPDHPDDEDDDPESGGAALSADPSVLWRLYGKSTGQYTAADPDVFMKPLDRFITAMSELTGLPRYSFTKASADLPSGAAARELNGERDATVKDRQDRYDPDWQDAYELALRMMDLTGIAVDVRWVPVSAVNDMDGLNVLKAKAELGVPSEVLLNEAGYPDELVKKWLESQETQSLPQRMVILNQLGTAVQALAAGVTQGIVSDNQAQALIARFIGLIAEGTSDVDATGPDALPEPTFREPPPVNSAMAAAEAAQADPVKQAQAAHIGAQAEKTKVDTEHARTIGVEAAKAGVEATRAGVESTKASTEMLKKGSAPQGGGRRAGSAR